MSCSRESAFVLSHHCRFLSFHQAWIPHPIFPVLPSLHSLTSSCSLTSFCSFSMVLSRCQRSFSISFFILLNCSFCSASSLSFSDNCFCSWVARLRLPCRGQGKGSVVIIPPGQAQEQAAERVSQPHHKAIRPVTSMIRDQSQALSETHGYCSF